MQAFFTVLLAAVVLRDRPTRRQTLAMAMAFVGIALIGSTTGADFTSVGLALGLASALSWAVGNVLVKRAVAVPVFPLVVWCSLVPPLPSLALSWLLDGPRAIVRATLGASWVSLGAVAYLGVLATVVAYATWGSLLQRHPTAAVAPFALLSPCVGVLASAALFGEIPGPTRYAGMALVLAGLAIVVVPASWFPSRVVSSACR